MIIKIYLLISVVSHRADTCPVSLISASTGGWPGEKNVQLYSLQVWAHVREIWSPSA